MDPLVSLKSQSEDLDVEFEILPVVDPNSFKDPRQLEIYRGVSSVEAQLAIVQTKIDEINAEIDRLTNHADGVDYATAVACGIITGIIDSVFVGEWDFGKAKVASNETINKKVIEFAKKHPDYKGGDRLDHAIRFLEGKKYKLPGDGDYKPHKAQGVTDKTHHLDDFCHHPTLVGLICCILVQFTGEAKYHPAKGSVIPVGEISVNKYGNFVSEESWGKILAGIINWFFTVAKVAANQKGHLMSDMAGSSGATGDGAGIPGSFLSTLKELSALPCFKDSNFAENLRKAYQNGIGTGKKQLNLGVFNSLFEGASSKFDMRTEMAIGHELKRQSIPVVLNEIFVRGLYFIRRFVAQMKEKSSIVELDWVPLIPAQNRTIVRMMTIATGTFTAVDMADAAIRAAGKSGGTLPGFVAQMILKVNFVGVGRFAISVGFDVKMGIQRSRARDERMKLYAEQIALTDSRVFYKQADMWIEAENAGAAIEQVYNTAEKAGACYLSAMEEIRKSMENIGEYLPELQKKNPALTTELLNIIEWG